MATLNAILAQPIPFVRESSSELSLNIADANAHSKIGGLALDCVPAIFPPISTTENISSNSPSIVSIAATGTKEGAAVNQPPSRPRPRFDTAIHEPNSAAHESIALIQKVPLSVNLKRKRSHTDHLEHPKNKSTKSSHPQTQETTPVKTTTLPSRATDSNVECGAALRSSESQQILGLPTKSVPTKSTTSLRARAYFNRSGIHCYRNASLQALGTISKFRDLILSHSCDIPKLCISCHLKSVFEQHYKRKGERLSPHEPPQLRRISQFIGGAFARNRRLRQEDANEYIVLLLERLSTQSSKRSAKAIKAAINEIFNTVRVTKVSCLNKNCGKVSRTKSDADHLTITLNIPENIPKGHKITLEECLRYFTKVEHLADYKCEQCSQHGARKKVVFEAPPQVALIDLSRFKYSWFGGGKDRRKVSFPEMLDWSQYTLKQTGMGKLTAIICHESSVLDSGHYYTIVRIGENSWLKYDDEQITRIKSPLMGIEHQWYMLLYVNIDESM